MDDLSTVRSLMRPTPALHIIYAAIGVCLPLMMAVAEWRWRRTNDPAYLLLANVGRKVRQSISLLARAPLSEMDSEAIADLKRRRT
jgi:hypothetical protein